MTIKFRNLKIDDVIVIEDKSAFELQQKLKYLGNKCYIVDLQFSTTKDKDGMNFHNALVLVRYK